MPFSLNIVPHVASLDMYGAARTSTAYSLSGELVLSVSSTVPSTRPLFASSSQPSGSVPLHPEWQPTTVYISSIQLVFEGKMLLISRHSGHSSIRLCSVTKDLVQGDKPIVLTNAGVGRRRGSTSSLANGEIYPDSAGTMRWTMTFDIAIPGWLPPTRSFDDGTGSSYTIHAFAKYHDDYESCVAAMSKSQEPSATPSAAAATGLSSYLPTILPQPLSSLFSRSKTRSANATAVPIQVNRYRAPKSFNPFSRSAVPCVDEPEDLVPPQISHSTPSLFPVTLDAVETSISVPSSKDGTDTKKRIPLEILSGIEVVAGVPEYMALWEDRIPLSLRMRSVNKDEINKGLTLETFDVEVEQVERFRSVPCERYVTTYPVPGNAEQPPNKPLLTPHPYEAFYTLGIGPNPCNEPLQWTRTVPMVPTKKVNFRPAPVTGSLELDSDWAKMDLSVGVLRSAEHESPESSDESSIDEDERSGRALRRKLINIDYDSPYIKVRHELKVQLKLTYLPPAAAAEVDKMSKRAYAEAQSKPSVGKASKWAKRSLVDIRRQMRVAHEECQTEILLFSIPLRVAQVPEHVEKVYKLTRELAKVADSRNSTSSTRPRSIASSSVASRSASPFPLSSSSSSMISRATTPGLMSAGPSPLSITSALPTVDSSSYTVSTSSSLSSSLSNSSLPPSHPYASLPSFGALPPYCALYHSNGNRKESVDEVGWLPKYTEKVTEADPAIASESDEIAI